MNRQQLLNKIDEAWAMLHQAYFDLSDTQMTEPGVTGDWSAKDILAHVTIWEEEALKYLPLIIDGASPPRYAIQYGGIDAFNVLMLAKRRELSLSQVLGQLLVAPAVDHLVFHRDLLIHGAHVVVRLAVMEGADDRRVRSVHYPQNPAFCPAFVAPAP